MSTSLPAAPAVASPSTAPTAVSPRLVSLDALRGFDMFWILGADAAIHALADFAPSPVTEFLAEQLDHVEWEGVRFYDLIFPLFVFIVGVSLVFSLTKTIAQHGRAAAAKRILIRAAVLFLLGIFYNGGLASMWPDVRLVGVLQRIAIAYAAAGVLFCFLRPRALAGVTTAMLVGYWALMTFTPIRDLPLDRAALEARLGPAYPPDITPPRRRPPPEYVARVRELFEQTPRTISGRFEPGLNLANHVDFAHLPGGKYDIYYDPEGLLSNLPAIATCLLGVFAGLLLRRPDLGAARKLAWLAGAGAAALALGHLWGLQFPVVKKLWTSSYVLVAGGWSALLLALFYYVVDVRQSRWWTHPFVWIGMNPITLYLATSVVSFSRIAQRFVGGDVKVFLDTKAGAGFGQFVIATGGLLLLILVARFLYVRRIFLRV